MAVMEKMRDYTKLFLIFLVVAFVGTIIFDWGMDVTGMKSRNTTIAEVNGKDISVQAFSQLYEQELDNMRRRTGSDPSEGQLDFVRNQVYENLIRDELISQEIQKRGITATDKEIVHYIFEAPPEIMQKLLIVTWSPIWESEIRTYAWISQADPIRVRPSITTPG